MTVLDPDGEGRAVIQTLKKGAGGGGLSPKKFFRYFRPQFSLKIRWGGPLPWIRHCYDVFSLF